MKQATVKIPIHSLIDLITNSSTEIFVHSESSLQPCKDLIDELLVVWGMPGQKWNDLFDLKIEKDLSQLESWLEYYVYENGDEPEELEEIVGTDKDISKKAKKLSDYLSNNPAPQWLEDMDGFDYHIGSNLVITAKKPEYKKFADLLEKFLYSSDWYEHSNG